MADPVKTLTTDALSPTDDPLMRLQNEIDALGLTATPDPDLPFRGARWACLVTIWVAVSKSCPSMRRRIFPAGYGGGLYDWALIVDHRKQTVSLLSHRDVQARLARLRRNGPPPRNTLC